MPVSETKNQNPTAAELQKEALSAEKITQAIIDIDKAAKAILSAGLKQRTLVTLIHEVSRVPRKDIELVLNNLTGLRQLHLTK